MPIILHVWRSKWRMWTRCGRLNPAESTLTLDEASHTLFWINGSPIRSAAICVWCAARRW